MNTDQLNKRFSKSTAEEILEYFLKKFSEKIVLASSLGLEDQVLTDMALNIDPSAKIFFIDTGRHYQETYDVASETMKRYSMQYEVYFPDTEEVEKMMKTAGPNSFYESLELRKKCCEIRKIKPLLRALKNRKAWITGLRRDQGITRANIEKIEWDNAHNIIKINPIAQWTIDMVWDYIKKRDVPYNRLHKNGFPSIGCLPCTRAVANGGDIRSGRWWWESPEHKECGLHSNKHNGRE